jgi:hypothetical protein
MASGSPLIANFLSAAFLAEYELFRKLVSARRRNQHARRVRYPEFFDRVLYNKKGTAAFPFLFCFLPGRLSQRNIVYPEGR